MHDNLASTETPMNVAKTHVKVTCISNFASVIIYVYVVKSFMDPRLIPVVHTHYTQNLRTKLIRLNQSDGFPWITRSRSIIQNMTTWATVSNTNIVPCYTYTVLCIAISRWATGVPRAPPPGQSQSGIKMTVWISSFRIGMFPSK